MPTVLLITEQERLRLLFGRMAQAGQFRLRAAPTLSQGAEEIAVRLPHYVFVEASLAGLAGAEALCYLRGLLPEEAEVILMAREAAEGDEFRKAGGLFSLDLSLADEALERSIADILPRSVPQPAPPLPEPFPSSDKTARELLFTGPGGKSPIARPPVTRNKRMLWLIPLALAVITLSVIAYQAGSTPPVARPDVVVPAPQVAKQEGGKIPGNPIAARKTGDPAVGLAPAIPVKTSAPPRQGLTYTVHPGDTFLKILTKEFGYTYQEALTVVPEVKRLNGLNSLDDRITPGQTLVIPAHG
jgi:LysM repeat protein